MGKTDLEVDGQWLVARVQLPGCGRVGSALASTHRSPPTGPELVTQEQTEAVQTRTAKMSPAPATPGEDKPSQDEEKGKPAPTAQAAHSCLLQRPLLWCVKTRDKSISQTLWTGGL